MKKMMIALVAMVMMVMSVNAQSYSNYDSKTFERMCSYLELRVGAQAACHPSDDESCGRNAAKRSFPAYSSLLHHCC